MQKKSERSASHLFDNIGEVALPPRSRKTINYNVDRALKASGSEEKKVAPVRKAKRKNTARNAPAKKVITTNNKGKGKHTDTTKGSDKENAVPSFQTIAERRKIAKRKPASIRRSNRATDSSSATKKSLSSIFSSIEKGKYEEEQEEEEEAEEEEVSSPAKDSSPSEEDDEEEEELDESDEEEEDSDSDFDGKRKRTSNNSNRAKKEPKRKMRKIESDDEEDDGEAKFDKILAFRPHKLQKGEKASEDNQYDFLVKYQGKSYLHLEWVSQQDVELVPGGKQRLTRLFKDEEASEAHSLFFGEEADESKFYPTDFTQVDRIFASRKNQGETEYLVKWKAMAYDEATWEKEEDISEKFAHEIKAFKAREKVPSAAERTIPKRPSPNDFDEDLDLPEFRNGHELRDYQENGVRWLIFCWFQRRNSILADEMGLGKTVQSVGILHYLFTEQGNRGPFLVIAPMSTVEQWRREAEGWTNMNTIVFHGSAKSRELIRKHEWNYMKNGSKVPGCYKFNILITTFEMILSETSLLSSVPWEYMIIDEGHRIKNRTSKLFEQLQHFKVKHRLILTGTPMQNHIQELWTMLHFLDPHKFDTPDDFLKKFGNLKSTKQVDKLHETLAPYMLRRMKEDVDNTIPLKEETIITVDLSSVQKTYYRAILDKNREFLFRGVSVSSNVPSLVNVMMELRKCCNHPFLIAGAEDSIVSRAMNKQGTEGTDSNKKGKAKVKEDEVRQQCLIQSSSKLVLMDKLLSKLREDGHKVLIFSQMVKVLDILEDYLVMKEYPFERLDGGVKRQDRQAAIDRFTNEKEGFVFLLSTKAGGLGLNLTAADTVIIYDSDWNPQNDLQAQARCHRIGQTENVKIYRFVTKDTYESYMLDVASKKLGLNTVVLGRGDGAEEEDGLKPEEISSLLKYGAYNLFNSTEEEELEKEKDMLNEDIESIIKRSATISYEQEGEGEEKQNNDENKEGEAAVGKQRARAAAAMKGLAKVTYTTNTDENVNLNDADFWEKILPEYQTAKSLKKKLDTAEGDKSVLATPEERKQFLADIEKVINELKESLASRSSSYLFSSCNPLSEVGDLLKRIEANATSLFSAEEITRAILLREGLSSRRTRKTVQRTGQEALGEDEENEQEGKEKNRERTRERQPPPKKEETEEERKDKLSGGWSKTQVNNMRMHMLQYGLHRMDTLPATFFRGRHTDQVKSFCECMTQQCLSGPECHELYASFLENVLLSATEETKKLHKENEETSGEIGKWGSVAMDVVEGFKFASYLPGQLIKTKVTLKDSEAVKKKYLVVTLEKDATQRKAKGGDVRVYPIAQASQGKEEEKNEKGKEKEENASSSNGQEEHVVRMYAPGFAGKYSVRCIYFGQDGKMKDIPVAGSDLTFDVECHPLLADEKFKELIARSQKTWSNRLVLLTGLNSLFAKYGSRLEKLEALPKVTLKPPSWWWEAKDDKNLLIGTHMYGYGKTKELREDENLGFSEEALRSRLTPLLETKTPEEQKALGYDAKAKKEEDSKKEKEEKEEDKEEEESEEKENEENEEKGGKKKAAAGPFDLPTVANLNKRLTRLIQDLTKPASQKRKRSEKDEGKKKEGEKKKRIKKDSDDSKKKDKKEKKHKKDKDEKNKKDKKEKEKKKDKKKDKGAKKGGTKRKRDSKGGDKKKEDTKKKARKDGVKKVKEGK